MVIDPLISARSVSLSYDKKNEVIRSCSFDLAQGKLIGLVGRNGSGKSTLLKALVGFIKPKNGELLIQSKAVQNYTAKELAKLASIFLSSKVVPSFTTVYDLISLGRFPHTNYFGRLKEEDKNVLDRYLALLDIEHLKHKMATELSDGESQKVMLARVLTQDTPIVLLDEPTTFLDPPSKFQFFEDLVKIKNETQKTILIASHEWQSLEKICEEFLIFENNQIIQSTSLTTLLNQI